MNIRKAKPDDLNSVLSLYAHARQQMAVSGNPTQWGSDKPALETVLQDIRQGCLFLIESGGEIVGVFAFLLGEEPTYRTIEGKWQNDLPYGVIHRIAGNGRQKGILEQCLNFCDTFTHNLRIDTHRQNAIIRHLLQKNGFLECGIIYVEDKTPRIAFQRCTDDPKTRREHRKNFP